MSRRYSIGWNARADAPMPDPLTVLLDAIWIEAQWQNRLIWFNGMRRYYRKIPPPPVLRDSRRERKAFWVMMMMEDN